MMTAKGQDWVTALINRARLCNLGWTFVTFRTILTLDHFCVTVLQCVPILGRGFETGGYKCECRQGYEYPFEVIKIALSHLHFIPNITTSFPLLSDPSNNLSPLSDTGPHHLLRRAARRGGVPQHGRRQGNQVSVC